MMECICSRCGRTFDVVLWDIVRCPHCRSSQYPMLNPFIERGAAIMGVNYSDDDIRRHAISVLHQIPATEQPFTATQLQLCWGGIGDIISVCRSNSRIFVDIWDKQFRNYWNRLPDFVKEAAWSHIADVLEKINGVSRPIPPAPTFEGSCLVFDSNDGKLRAYKEGGLKCTKPGFFVVKDATNQAIDLMTDWAKPSKVSTYNIPTAMSRLLDNIKKQGSKAVIFLNDWISYKRKYGE